jgi:membrane protease YdiL (CAAX protease family)
VLTGIVMSMGAGFYEELAFRVVLFGLGAKFLVWLFAQQQLGVVERSPRISLKAAMLMVGWSVVSAAVFSGAHYIGSLRDPFDLKSFVFRLVLGLALTLIFVTRGFAAAVWAHALYDVWVLVL